MDYGKDFKKFALSEGISSMNLNSAMILEILFSKLEKEDHCRL